MTDWTRRDVVRLLSVAPLAGAFELSAGEIHEAWKRITGTPAGRQTYAPKFFSPHEWQTVRVLVDLVIPPDSRSGGATDAGVPEFMDFILDDSDSERRKTAMRGGLAWLDIECRERFGKTFIDCADAERRQLLDLIAWPAKAPAELSHGVDFFNSFRDFTASGFWSSKMGIADIGYLGNTFVEQWTGCPQEQLDRLGVSYEDD